MSYYGAFLVFSDHSDHHQPYFAAIAMQTLQTLLVMWDFFNDMLLTKPSQILSIQSILSIRMNMFEKCFLVHADSKENYSGPFPCEHFH